MLKKLMMATIIVSMVLVSCVHGSPKIVADQRGVERPIMTISPELERKYIDTIQEPYEVIGIIVDNFGSILIYVEHPETGECGALLVAVQDEQVLGHRFFTCEEADQIYQDICVKQQKCNENPYIDGKV